jgi:hypothetical protein
MGLFSRKKSEPSAAPQTAVPRSYPWQLTPSDASAELTVVDTEALELILEQSGSPNKNQQAPVTVTAVGDQSLAVHWDGRLIGHVDGLEAVPYVPGLRFLQSTHRFAVTTVNVASRKSKYHGTASLSMPYSGAPFVPFNQPSEDLPFVWIRPTIKDERFHVGELRALASEHKTPGWFILRPTTDGEVVVYTRPYGSNASEIKVGAVIKDDQAETITAINNSPACTFGRVYWFNNGPDIRLGL